LKKTITIERNFDASVEEVWELWTTKDGIESWWGPDGFDVAVLELDLRKGGTLHYAMTARGPEQIEFMKKAGMPLSHAVRGTFREIVPNARLVYTNLIDFVPNVAPFETEMKVELQAAPKGMRLVLTIDAMHDEHWTKMAVMGWESQLGKLAKLIEKRK
jgi:uncharacterized protein YndB with AHSA1/START domain